MHARALRLFALACCVLLRHAHANAAAWLYVGTYTNSGSQGIYALRLDTSNGSLSRPELAVRTPDPSFLALSPIGNRLYAANEREATVRCFVVDRHSGQLDLLGVQPSGGSATAYVGVDPSGVMLVGANYGRGTVCIFPIANEGRLLPRSMLVRDLGRPGPNTARQNSPHPHSVAFSHDGRYAFICELGLDRVFVYRVDAARADLTEAKMPYCVIPAGSGPRHSALSADDRFLYVINEMGGSLCVLSFDPSISALKLLQTMSTLPIAYRGFNGSADIQISPDGRYIYVSNRGPDTIAVFARDQANGLIRSVEDVSCGGCFPRNFVISTDGRWLVCANQKSDRLAVFKVNRATGRLALAAVSSSISQPTCVLLLP